MTDEVIERAVVDFIVRALGCVPTRLARRAAFVTNLVFDVDIGSEQFIVKASRLHHALRAEAWACSEGARAGCGAPEILAFGRVEIADPLSAYAMPRLAGDPIAAAHPAWAEVGRRIRRLHEVKLPGFGALADAREDGRVGYLLSHDSWTGYLENICADTCRLANGSAFAGKVADALAAALEVHSRDLAAVEQGSLCHGDLKLAHILVDGGRLSGVIDWGDAAVADPLWDIARFAHRADAAQTDSLLAGYDPDGTLAGDLAWRLPLYGALWMLVDAIVDDRLGHDVRGLLDGAMRSLVSLRDH
jgi:hypothetical protein